MKNIIALLAIVGIVFSSCNGKYTIAKRKYTKGFYVSKSGNSTTKPSVTESKTVKVNAPVEKVETVVVVKAEENKIDITPLKTLAAKSIEQSPSIKTPAQSPAVASTSNNNYTKINEIKPIEIDKIKANTSKKGSDSNLILMIILCFLWFLNLIAIYMHDGGITLNFWITLLLDFTVIGGVIFSLLVVLDVIDLS